MSEPINTPSNPSQEKPSPVDSHAIAGAYFERFNAVLASEKEPKQLALLFGHRLGSPYFMDILRTLSEIDRLCREMHSVLDEFTGRDLVLVKLLTIDHLAIAMKLYVISWSTLLDLLAYLVNKVFNLGLADKDVRLYLVLNNNHVRSSRIPEILKKYESASLIKHLREKRNELMHRGRIPDDDIEQMLRERNTIDSRRYPILKEIPISEE